MAATVAIWQAKFFIDGAGQAQQSQIRESFEASIAAAQHEGHTLEGWTLCMPVSFDAPTAKWWSGWRRRMTTKHGVRIELWDDTELEALLLTPDAAPLRHAYFHAPAVPAPSPPVKPLPAGITYDEMLFMKQLRAANVNEVESAKRQFFNADLLAREVADKQVPEHMQALETSSSAASATATQRAAKWPTCFTTASGSSTPRSKSITRAASCWRSACRARVSANEAGSGQGRCAIPRMCGPPSFSSTPGANSKRSMFSMTKPAEVIEDSVSRLRWQPPPMRDQIGVRAL